jgi:hypothetical protein
MVPLTYLWVSERGCLHEKLIYDRLVRAVLGNVSAEGLRACSILSVETCIRFDMPTLRG